MILSCVTPGVVLSCVRIGIETNVYVTVFLKCCVQSEMWPRTEIHLQGRQLIFPCSSAPLLQVLLLPLNSAHKERAAESRLLWAACRWWREGRHAAGLKHCIALLFVTVMLQSPSLQGNFPMCSCVALCGCLNKKMGMGRQSSSIPMTFWVFFEKGCGHS